MLEGGRPYDVVSLEARNKANERLISHLNIQVDFLQQKNRDMERQLDDMRKCELSQSTRQLDLDAKNQVLQDELDDVDRLAKQLQDDKKRAVNNAGLEVAEAHLELDKSRHQLDQLELENAQLTVEKDNLISENEDIKSRLMAMKSDYSKLEALQDKVQEDKRKLSTRVNKLTANERELVLEIERLKATKGVSAKKKTKAGHLEAFIKGLEGERDYWRAEVETLQKMLKLGARSPSRSSRCPSRCQSPTRSSSRPPSRNQSPTRSPSKSLKNRTPSPKPSSTPTRGKKKNAAHYEALINVLEDERDYYKREYEIARGSRSPPTSDKCTHDVSVIHRLQRERDELQCLLDKFERHMAEIQANVKILTSERDSLNRLYEETKSELQQLRRQIVKSPKSPKVSLAAQSVLRRVECERDDALADLRRMITERDSLRERLKIATESQLSDRAHLEQRIEDLQNNMKIIEVERDDLGSRVTSLRELLGSLEEKLKDQVQLTNAARDEANQNKGTAGHMKLLAEQAERSLDEQQRRMIRREADLRSAQDKINLLEDRMKDMIRMQEDSRDESIKLRQTISELDKEKDMLQVAVDEKTERLAGAEDELAQKNQLCGDQRMQTSELENKLKHTNEGLAYKEHEITSLRRQLDAAQRDNSELSRAREGALRENRRLQEDLAVMTKTNQGLNTDLDDAMAETSEFRSQVQDYVSEVKRVEELLAQKEEERSDLLEQYRQLSLEADRFQAEAHQLESEGSTLRLEVLNKEGDVRRLKDRIEQLEREISESRRAEQQYELQVSNLTKSVANLEGNNRDVEEERHGLLRDVAAVRDLCSRLEANKDQLQRQLNNKNLDVEQLQNSIDELNHEIDVMKAQLSSEKANVQNLEDIIQNNREKEFSAQLSTQEKSAEVQLLKDRLDNNESKLDAQSRELSQLRTRNLEIETECESLRRQLTAERFEKERCIQELRRTGITPPASARAPVSTSRGSYSPVRYEPAEISTIRDIEASASITTTAPKELPPDLYRSPTPNRRSRSPYSPRADDFQ
ncbi:uncharacterized protein LOC141906138 isoform X2 [Tubulanus polymorphus]|uniref:uncharacterized protein LOC141906138 isoform X2 n=1 Tax=Tubulanus polymorphus TaxID=672921 RepID=UPI003DA3EF63